MFTSFKKKKNQLPLSEMYLGSFKRFYYYYHYCKFSNTQNQELQ